jgi:hypothetical protein
MGTFGYKNHVVVYSVDKDHTIFVMINGKYWKVLGECSKCGECCEGCEYLVKETVDGVVQYRCKIQHKKPVDCALFPCTPDKKNTPNCTFSYQELSKENLIKELWKVI